MNFKYIPILLLVAGILFSCNNNTGNETPKNDQPAGKSGRSSFAPVKLTTDLSKLTESEKKMLPLLIEAAKIMDDLFWYEAYGDKDAFLASIPDEVDRKFAAINYGPWDRLGNDKSFIEGIGEKPAGANFYPKDMTKEEFEAANLPDKKSPYTFLRRDEAGKLKTVWYHDQFAAQIQKAAGLLNQAAEMSDDPSLHKYLELRAEALLTDQYFESDMAWMDMKTNGIDFVIGPIESYEDKIFGYKASHEAYILVKDREWSERLAKYAAMLPDLQKALPVDAKYKAEKPGTDSDLNAYDVVYYAGDCNSGAKTIAINLPNDEKVQLEKGTRRLQLKNAMQAKFDQIMMPVSSLLIAEDQRQYVKFDAFFANTMFHEVAHGLGIKNTINNKGTVKDALKEHYSALEEGKADIVGLIMVTQLLEKGELDGDLKEYYTTFLAGVFRSVRFGASSAHGKANMIRFNFFQEMGAFERDAASGTYRVNFDKMKDATAALSRLILTLQGDGDYDGVIKLLAEKGNISPELQGDLDRLKDANIPVDIVLEQGLEALGL